MEPSSQLAIMRYIVRVLRDADGYQEDLESIVNGLHGLGMTDPEVINHAIYNLAAKDLIQVKLPTGTMRAFRGVPPGQNIVLEHLCWDPDLALWRQFTKDNHVRVSLSSAALPGNYPIHDFGE